MVHTWYGEKQFVCRVANGNRTPLPPCSCTFWGLRCCCRRSREPRWPRAWWENSTAGVQLSGSWGAPKSVRWRGWWRSFARLGETSIRRSRRTLNIPPEQWSSPATQGVESWRTTFFDCSPFCWSSWNFPQRWWTSVRGNAPSDVDAVSTRETVGTTRLVRGRGRTRPRTGASPADRESPQSRRRLSLIRLLQACVLTFLFRSYVEGLQPMLGQRG